jgi:hypothetical protein
MKPTAVQWFFEWMDNNQYFIGNDLLEAFKQAKEMEHEQHSEIMVKSYEAGINYVQELIEKKLKDENY